MLEPDDKSDSKEKIITNVLKIVGIISLLTFTATMIIICIVIIHLDSNITPVILNFNKTLDKTSTDVQVISEDITNIWKYLQSANQN